MKKAKQIIIIIIIIIIINLSKDFNSIIAKIDYIFSIKHDLLIQILFKKMNKKSQPSCLLLV